jgi:Na+-translocating ferredoxin:NAD+ oxidoreductase RnfC subunit
MSTFASLKLTAAQKPSNISAVQVRRNKLAQRLAEQAALAKALQTGAQFTATRLRTVKDEQTGERTAVEVSKKIKAWWFTADNGKLALSVRYGARQLELAKGKYAIEVANERELLTTLEVVREAVIAGQLDAAIEAVSNKVRAGFGN